MVNVEKFSSHHSPLGRISLAFGVAVQFDGIHTGRTIECFRWRLLFG